jgi:hypothetical protein
MLPLTCTASCSLNRTWLDHAEQPQECRGPMPTLNNQHPTPCYEQLQHRSGQRQAVCHTTSALPATCVCMALPHHVHQPVHGVVPARVCPCSAAEHPSTCGPRWQAPPDCSGRWGRWGTAPAPAGKAAHTRSNDLRKQTGEGKSWCDGVMVCCRCQCSTPRLL